MSDTKRNVRSAPEELVADLLGEIRRRFYDARPNGSKEFYEDRRLLLQAVLYPARYLAPRGVRLPWARYREVFLGICETIEKKGNVRQIRRVCGYLLHSTQEHMRHHWDEYHNEGKALGDDLTAAILAIRQIQKKPSPAADNTVDALDRLAAVIPKGGRKKKPAATGGAAIQSELF